MSSDVHFKADSAPKPRPRLAALAALAIGLGLVWRVVQYALGLPVWGDEAFVGVNFLMRDYAGMIEPLVYGQICPLLFMWAELAVSRLLGYSEWALRLLPFLAGLAGFALFMAFARKILARSEALMAIAIFASSYFVVRHAAEIKPYSGDLLVSLALTALAVAVGERPRCLLRWSALILLAGAGVWASYPSMFVAGAVGLFLTLHLVRQRFSPGFLAGWLTFGLVLIGNALWMYLIYAKPHAAQASDVFELASWQSTFPPLDRPWQVPLWLLDTHTGYLFAYPQGGHAPGSAITFILFLVGAIRLYRKDRALLLLLLAPFVLNMIAAALKAYPYGRSARVSQHLAPMVCLLAGLGLSVLLRGMLARTRIRLAVAVLMNRVARILGYPTGRSKFARHVGARFQRISVALANPIRRSNVRLGLTIAAVGFGLIPIAGIARAVMQPYKSEEVYKRREAVESLVARTSPGDRWVMFNSIDKNDYAPWLGDWRGIGAQFLFDVMRFAPIRVAYSPPAAAVDQPSDGALWLLVYYAKRQDKEKMVPFDEGQLEAYLADLTARLGPPAREELKFVDRPGKYESLRVYRWSASKEGGGQLP